MPVEIHLDVVLRQRAMTINTLSEKTGILIDGLERLERGEIKAIRFETLSTVCTALGCQPGDLFSNIAPGEPTSSGV